MRALARFFFTFDGRIPRGQWWLGQVPLAVASLLSTRYFDPNFFDLAAPAVPPNIYDTILQIALAVPTLALISKRLNDRGWPRGVLYFTAVVFLALLTGPHFGLWADTASDGPVDNAAALLALVTIVALAVDNGMLRGQTGANAYGPDPLAPPAN